MGDILDIGVPSSVRLLLPLGTFEYVFDDRRQAVIIKRRPLLQEKYVAGARHWIEVVGPYVRGGFRVYPVEGQNGVWERRLPYGLIRVRKHNDCYTVEAKGYHVFVPVDNGNVLRPAKENEIPPVEDWWVWRLFDDSMHSRTCWAEVYVRAVKGSVYAVCDGTATKIDSKAFCVVFIKNNTIYKIVRKRGEYRGACWTEEEVWKLAIRVKNGAVTIIETRADREAVMIETGETEIV